MSRELNTNRETILRSFRSGIRKLRDIVAATYGPNGLNVVIDKALRTPVVTKDGVSVATEVFLSDPLEAAACEIAKEAAKTVVDSVGDGTTTTIILIDELLSQNLETRPNHSMASSLKEAEKVAIDFINGVSRDIKSRDEVKAIAKISSNNDEQIAELIATAFEKTGHATIVVSESKSTDTTLHVTQGMEINRGWTAPQFANRPNMCWEEENVRVLLYDGIIKNANELLPVLEHCNKNTIPLLIIANEFEGEALSVLLVNSLKGSVRVCAVRAPLFDQKRDYLMEDIAIVTGGMIISDKTASNLSDLGHNGKRESYLGTAKSVKVSRDSTTILSVSADKEALDQRVQQVVNLIREDWENQRFHEARFARLTGGISEIKVGGETDVEMQQRLDRIDDAVCAAKAAITSGGVAGSGYTFLRAANHLEQQLDTEEAKALSNALRQPYFILHGERLKNEENVYQMFRISDNGNQDVRGADIQTGERIWLKQSGIIDPTDVLIQSIKAAVSCAITLFTTGGSITMLKAIDPMDDVKYSRRN